MIDELADAVDGRRSAIHDGAWGRATVAACLAIRESAEAGSPISLKGETLKVGESPNTNARMFP
jgi:hypothetical protein